MNIPGPGARRAVALSRSAGAALILLASLCLAWEMFLAPLRPGGSWLALKALPALVPLAGILQGRRYTFQWASMLVLAYMGEGLVRSVTDSGAGRVLAVLELCLSLAFFLLATRYVRKAGAMRASPR
jgi:uncharacterized membrane protein